MDHLEADHHISTWLTLLAAHQGTDLLLNVGSPPFVRVNGLLYALPDSDLLTEPLTAAIAQRLMPTSVYERFQETWEADFAFDWGEGHRLRANAFRQRGSVGLALRLLPSAMPTFESLRLPPAIPSLVNLTQGLILVTGPTGSGKTTTLAALINRINETRQCHIITIEDPVEYVHRPHRSMVTQREVGIDTKSFAAALRAALREDPDVILVGELRDLESIQLAMTAAETGHLVLATLHTNDASQTVDRIVDVFPADQQNQIRTQLAGTLSAVIAQRLLPRIGGGQVPAFEVMMATTGVRNQIREGRTQMLRNIIQTGSSVGMVVLEASLIELVNNGEVDPAHAAAVASHPAELLANGSQ